MALNLRYVDMKEFKIKEEFLGFMELSSTTGSAIKDAILKQIEYFSLEIPSKCSWSRI